MSSISAATQSASAIDKAVTTVGPNKNSKGLDAASVNEVLKDGNGEAEEETSTGSSSSQTASRATSGIFSSNRPATQAPFPVTPTATSPNSSQQAPMMPPMGMGSMPKIPDLPKPNPKNNEPWKGNGAKEEKTPDKLTPPGNTPPGNTDKALIVTDKNKISALNEAFNTKNPQAADPRKALLFIYTDKNSKSLNESLQDPANQELLAKHYNPAHIHKDENGKITVNGQAHDPKSLIAPLINTKFEKSGAVIIANAGDAKFKEIQVKGESLDTKKLIAAKDSNLHFIEVHTEPVIDAHIGDQDFQKYLEANAKKNEKLLDLLKIYQTPAGKTGPKADLETLGDKLHEAWKEYLNQ